MTPVEPTEPPSRLPDAVLRPAVGNAFETTVEQLATAIRLGVFVAGDQLPPERGAPRSLKMPAGRSLPRGALETRRGKLLGAGKKEMSRDLHLDYSGRTQAIRDNCVKQHLFYGIFAFLVGQWFTTPVEGGEMTEDRAISPAARRGIR